MTGPRRQPPAPRRGPTPVLIGAPFSGAAGLPAVPGQAPAVAGGLAGALAGGSGSSNGTVATVAASKDLLCPPQHALADLLAGSVAAIIGVLWQAGPGPGRARWRAVVPWRPGSSSRSWAAPARRPVPLWPACPQRPRGRRRRPSANPPGRLRRASRPP